MARRRALASDSDGLLGQQRPRDTGVLGGDRDAGTVIPAPLPHRKTASAHRDNGSVRLTARCSTARAPMTSRVLRYGSPRLVMCPSRVLPPLEYWRGTSPSQAANWRPFLKSWPLPTVATKADAVMGPMPRRVCTRQASALEPTCILISCSYSSALACSRTACSSRSRAQAATRVGSLPSSGGTRRRRGVLPAINDVPQKHVQPKAARLSSQFIG